jgi:energy-coupling factor transport system ATP-binding protein
VEPDALIDIKNLSYTYPGSPGPALSDLSFRIDAGERTALLGANGSGKSTVLSCLNGLLIPPGGTVAVCGLDPAEGTSLEAIRRRLGTVLQNPDDQIISSVVEEDIAFGPENAGLSGDALNRRVEEVLERCDLVKLRDRPPHFLSGGERQRLALAGVLALDTEIIALDEAVSMLDPAGRESFLALLDKLNGEGKTIIQVTHFLEEAFRCKRCLVLHKGALVFDGPPQELVEQQELEVWGFTLPEPVKAIRMISKILPDFKITSLDSEEFAKAIVDREKTEVRIGKKEKPPASLPSYLPTPDTPPRPLIRFSSASHQYLPGTNFAAAGMKDVNFELPAPGLTLGIIGKSGSGKSTVLKHINALLLPTGGRVEVFGEDTLDKKTKLPGLRSRAALSVQSPESALFETYTADDIAFGPANEGLKGRALKKRVVEAMEETGLPFGDFADRKVRSLSGGEKRRAAIAGAAAMDSEILLLDEPLAGLDGRNRGRILAMIEGRRNRAPGATSARPGTVIVSTHSMETAASFDLLAVMVDGTMTAFAAPGEIFGPAWNPAWGLAPPWTVRVARTLANAGLIPGGSTPLTAEELISCIFSGEIKERNEERRTRKDRAPDTDIPHPCLPASYPLPFTRRRKKTGIEFFRNVTFGQFLDKPSALRKLSAGWKLLILLLCMAAVVAGAPPFFPLGVLALTLFAGRILGKTGPGYLFRGMVPIIPWLIIILLLQIFFMPKNGAGMSPPKLEEPGFPPGTVVFSYGHFYLTLQELFRVLGIFLRLSALMSLLSLYSAVTPLRETMGALNRFLGHFSRFGFPSRDASLAAGISLRFVPILTEEAEHIVSAQLSRGTRKGKISMILSTVVPLFLRALERSGTMAKAMMLRLYQR